MIEAAGKPVIRYGIAGSGFAARFHHEALERVYTVQTRAAGVWSPTSKNRAAFASEHNIRGFDSLEAMIQESDVIHVCTPPASHEKITIDVLRAGKNVIVEKPFTGYYGDGSPDFNGDTFDKAAGMQAAMDSVARMRAAESESKGRIFYAENWVYAPAVQKERELIEKTGAQILWIHGEESHSGSHSPYYGIWSHSGGGSIIGKGVHPLTAALYLKAVEGLSKRGKPIRPVSVSARTHAITRSPGFQDAGFIKTGYRDIEDWGGLHVSFSDETFADVFASEIVMGGTHNWIDIAANNHRSRLNINPNNAMATFNPKASQFSDIYVVEKIETKEGWASTSPDEDWFTGYQHEMNEFYADIAKDRLPASGSLLAADVIATAYAAYVSASNGAQETAIPLIDND